MPKKRSTPSRSGNFRGRWLAAPAVPVKYLDNGTTVRQLPLRAVTYHHFELCDHAIVEAEELTVETLLPGSDKTGFAHGALLTRLHLYFSSRHWEAFGVAPLVLVGAELDAVRRRLDRRAAEISPRPREVPWVGSQGG